MEQAPEIHENCAEQRFELAVGDHMAVATYELVDSVMTFTHTFVPTALRGRGLATRLVVAGIDAARNRGYMIDPRCSTFAAYVKAHPETHDLLTLDAQTALGV